MDNKEFATTIVKTAQTHLEEHSLTAVSVPNNFCTLWTKAKPLLTTVAGFIIFIPGAGAVAGAVLKGLITIGDQVYGMECAVSSPVA